jgi:hypothetical protein
LAVEIKAIDDEIAKSIEDSSSPWRLRNTLAASLAAQQIAFKYLAPTLA